MASVKKQRDDLIKAGKLMLDNHGFILKESILRECLCKGCEALRDAIFEGEKKI